MSSSTTTTQAFGFSLSSPTKKLARWKATSRLRSSAASSSSNSHSNNNNNNNNAPSSRPRGLGNAGLSKYHQSILSRMVPDRQRFVTGKYPVICQVAETPTLKWLVAATTSNSRACTSQLLVNGTSVDRSLASYDRFQWLDDEEREELHDKYALTSWELLAIISISKPGYVNIMPGTGAGSTAASLRFLESTPHWERWKMGGKVLEELEDRVCRERLWVSGFSLTGRAGILNSIDTNSGHIESVNKRTAESLLWPNEVSPVPSNFIISGSNTQAPSVATTHANNLLRDAVLVSDGFLVPGKDRGGIYVVKQPGNPQTEWNVCLTDERNADRWFYHRAVWVDLTGDGRKSILTARATSPFGSSSSTNSPDNEQPINESNALRKSTTGQLVCLEMPEPYEIDETTGTPLERDGTVFDPLNPEHLPWKTHVLAEGPDVMFNVVDMDDTDDTIEVMSSEFFGKKVTLHSIQRGAIPKVTFQRTIDDTCGKAFGCIVADLEETATSKIDDSNRYVIDGGSTVETLKAGDAFSHLLVTSHECSLREVRQSKRNMFGGLDSEQTDLDHVTASTATTHTQIHESASSSSAPTDGGSLFAYKVPTGKGKWKTDEWKRTTVATGFKVQGQLNNMINPGAPGFVYTFHERLKDKRAATKRRPLIAVAGDCADSAYVFRPTDSSTAHDNEDGQAKYDLMCEIQCGGTVGSIGVGYGDFCETEQEPGYAKLYIPCYEKDKVLVFGLGGGEDD